MKIIATTGSNWLIEISKDDLAKLLGYYYSSAAGMPTISVGTEVDIHSMYAQIVYLRDNKKTLKEIAARLENYAKELKLIDPIK